jgi:hypothetical protein
MFTMDHGPIQHRPLIHRHVRRQREQQSLQLFVIETVGHATLSRRDVPD